MTLYEITEDITKESEEAVTIKEARRINDRYYLRAADRTLSRNKDRNLLLEYDLIRQQLLRKKK